MNNIIEPELVIDWKDSIEYIEIDPNNLSGIAGLSSSRLFWRDTRESVQLNISSKVNKHDNGDTELIIQHNKDSNSHMSPDATSWGESSIIIKHGDTQGTLDWKDVSDPDNSGPRNWAIHAVEFNEDPEYEHIKRLKRAQKKFKNALLKWDSPICSISREPTLATVQAAHIIAKKNLGPDIPANGILLRADIHQLYDADLFKIDPAGNVVDVDVDNLSDNYIKLLLGAKLEPSTLNRVKKCLAYKWHNVYGKPSLN